MRIVVCVKHVPDAQSDRRIEDGRVVRGEDDVLNELDENAVEEAVSLVEAHGGEVVAVTMGPEDAHDAVMRALQMGADRGVVVTDDRLAGADAIATAAVLAAAVRRLGSEAPVDLVVTGMASLDGMTSMVPAALAAELRWPALGLAHALEVSGAEGDWRVRAERSADGFDEVSEAGAPVVVSVTDQINEPRYPSFQTMRAARAKPVEQWTLDDLAEGEGLPPSSTRVLEAGAVGRSGPGTVIADSGDAGERLARYLIEEAE
ncbi:electron transfer flavoprotein subunit beta/FixA family protein [Schaalia naturae]|jgi:electron transfer flavoprotein beta subunit|uniref:Electron transfer flavoprotein subunit beta n=1 Tax=Schaalia naturae TaxID=635203 RepID=A0ABW2SK87_9ACTO